MSQTELRSKSVRRRLTIAALVLLMLGGGLWWSASPRIDPNLLIGEWHGLGDADVECDWRFDSRESCALYYTGPTFGSFAAYDWQVRGSRLILFPQYRSPPSWQNLWNWLSLIGIGSTESCVYRIVEFKGDLLTLEAEKRGDPDTPKSIKLSRDERQTEETR